MSRSRSRNQKRERAPDKGLPRLERNMSACEARIAKVSARIDQLKQTRAGASKPQLAQLDPRLQQLEKQRVALAEQLELQKSLLSTREQERARLLTTYEREDKLGTNEEARRLMAEHPPVLDDLQSELVARLRTDGIAEIEFARLFSTDLWKDVTEEATTFGREAERRLTGSPEKTTPKELAHRRYDKDAELPLDDPWLRIAVSSRLLDVVDAYLGMWGKLTHCNQVYEAAPPEDTESWENWHRDAQDKRLVRVVLHLSDVQAGTDQLEYVPGSTGEGPYAALWPWAPGRRRVAPATEFAELVPDSAIRTLSPRAGTIVLWNASGLHREVATARGPQILWKCSYSSPASFTNRKFRVQLPEPCDLSEAARFAVS